MLLPVGQHSEEDNTPTDEPERVTYQFMLSHHDSQHAHRHTLHEVLRLHSNFTMRLIIVPNYWTYVAVTVYLC